MGCLLSIYHSALLKGLGCAVCSCISTVIHESPCTWVMPGLDLRRQRLNPKVVQAVTSCQQDLGCWMVSDILWVLCPSLHPLFSFCCFPSPALLQLQLGSQDHVCVSGLHMETRSLQLAVAVQ